MGEAVYSGRCLSCGAPAYDQSHCNRCEDWDGEWDCPESNDHTGNMVVPDEPLKDCLDHVEDEDLREYIRKEGRERDAIFNKQMGERQKQMNAMHERIKELESRLRYKEAHIEELEAAVKAVGGFTPEGEFTPELKELVKAHEGAEKALKAVKA